MRITFEDRDKIIKFSLRNSITGTTVKTVSVRKSELSIPLSDQDLAEEDRTYIDSILESYRQSEAAKRRSFLLELPVIVRMVVEHCESGQANEAELELVAQTLDMGNTRLKRMRRARIIGAELSG